MHGYGSHAAVNYGYHGGLYQQLLPVVHQVLDILLENDFEESSQSITTYILALRFRDTTDIAQWMQYPPEVVRGKVLEGLLYWIRAKTKILDEYIFSCSTGLARYAQCSESLKGCRRRLDAAFYQSSADEILSEFAFSVVVDLLGRDASCLANVLAGVVVRHSHTHRQDMLDMVEQSPRFLAFLVRSLEEVQAKIARVVVDILSDSQEMEPSVAKDRMLTFFQFHTVDTEIVSCEEHVSPEDPPFIESLFRIQKIDSMGNLMGLLTHIEEIVAKYGDIVAAVDFEGKASNSGWNRYGSLCLMQITLNDRPTHTFVLDVCTLGKKTFKLTTPTGMSIRRLLEEPSIRKIWWDCRNDADVLWHNFKILPRGVFDLQIGEVAARRSTGVDVRFCCGLQKALMQSPALTPQQKQFAESIDQWGKQLYEPNYGGNYEMFEQRPINPIILIYAAHDTRYQLLLFHSYVEAIGEQWTTRVLAASEVRGRWGLSPDYMEPTPQAPDL